MTKKRQMLLSGVALILSVGLSACGPTAGAHRSDGPAEARHDDTVSGLRDDVRHITRKTASAVRPRMVNRCTTTTKKIKHTSRTRMGKRSSTTTWYEKRPVTTCRKVRSGTESYTRVIRHERWCVELDAVNGDQRRRDVWFQVTHATYAKARTAQEGDKIKFTPVANGC
uniref:DNA polymerase III alpha subunit n=1 Tax=Streptomyces sp. FR1 TaxID=349971 RepID=V9Z6W8_9ACTN|nr:hypothetical protein [Streptomyces sp. FR1]AHE39131.1 DNA polymerase III alpha subunit [Streptomyces sp. FR1]